MCRRDTAAHPWLVWVGCTDGLGTSETTWKLPRSWCDGVCRGRGLLVKGKRELCSREHTPEMKVRGAGRCPESSCENEEGGDAATKVGRAWP